MGALYSTLVYCFARVKYGLHMCIMFHNGCIVDIGTLFHSRHYFTSVHSFTWVHYVSHGCIIFIGALFHMGTLCFNGYIMFHIGTFHMGALYATWYYVPCVCIMFHIGPLCSNACIIFLAGALFCMCVICFTYMHYGSHGCIIFYVCELCFAWVHYV